MGEERQMMSDQTTEIDVEQFANETVRLTGAITRVLNAPDILTGEVSGSGKTIAVEHGGATYRLDTATIMAGDSEFRDSYSFELYTRERFQSTQSANYGPGPQAGANGVSDAADLPEPTHTPVGQDSEDADSEDDDPDADGDPSEDTEDGRDEFGRIREGERVHLTGETSDGEELDAAGTVTNVTGTETAVELDDGRLVRKQASVIKARSPEGKPLYFRNPVMTHMTGEEHADDGANHGDEGGKTAMTDGGEDGDTLEQKLETLTAGDSVEVETSGSEVFTGVVSRVSGSEISVDPRDDIHDRYVIHTRGEVDAWREWWDDHEGEPKDERVGLVHAVHVAETDGGREDWNPEAATLRDGETVDMDAHARRNAEQVRIGPLEADSEDANPRGEPMTDGGEDTEGGEREDGVIPTLSEGEDVRLGLNTLPTARGGQVDRKLTATVTDTDHKRGSISEGGQSGFISMESDDGPLTLTYNVFDARVTWGDTDKHYADPFAVVVSADRVETDGGASGYDCPDCPHTADSIEDMVITADGRLSCPECGHAPADPKADVMTDGGEVMDVFRVGVRVNADEWRTEYVEAGSDDGAREIATERVKSRVRGMVTASHARKVSCDRHGCDAPPRYVRKRSLENNRTRYACDEHRTLIDNTKAQDGGADDMFPERGEPVTDGGVDIPAGHEYDTKTVRVHLPERGKYVYLMMTRFDGEGGILAREGWRGTYVWYSVVSRNGQACVSGADPWDLSRRYPSEWFPDSAASALMKDMDMDRIPWSDITDGDHLTPEDVDALAGGDSDE